MGGDGDTIQEDARPPTIRAARGLFPERPASRDSLVDSYAPGARRVPLLIASIGEARAIALSPSRGSFTSYPLDRPQRATVSYITYNKLRRGTVHPPTRTLRRARKLQAQVSHGDYSRKHAQIPFISGLTSPLSWRILRPCGIMHIADRNFRWMRSRLSKDPICRKRRKMTVTG